MKKKYTQINIIIWDHVISFVIVGLQTALFEGYKLLLKYKILFK